MRRLRLRWEAVAAMTLALCAASAPYLYGWMIRPAGTRFWAVPPVNASDANQYLAFTRLAAKGQVLIGDPFTPEPTARALFMPQVLFQGLLCRIFAWTPTTAFHASRVLSGLVLLLAAWWLGTQLLPRRGQRRLFLLLLCFSAGAGWFLDHGNRLPVNADFFQPEGNTFFTLENLPHLALSSGLLTVIFAALVALERQPERWRRWCGVVLTSGFLLAWTHPFDFLVLALALPVYAAVRWVERRQFPATNLAHLLVLGAGALPGAVYLSWLTRTDPVYRALANDPSQVQSFAYYAAQHAFLAVPAVVVLLNRRLASRLALPLCWVLCAFLFLTTPFHLGGKQGRVVGGVHVPLALLAAAGLEEACRRLCKSETLRKTLSPAGARAAAVGLATGFVALTATGVWGILERHVRYYARRGPDFYLSPGVQQALDTIDRARMPDQVTLAGSYTGGWAPVWADTRVWDGHWQMTLDEPAKRAQRDDFYFTPGNAEVKSQWLRLHNVRWVIWYPSEWGTPPVPLEGIPGLERVGTAPDVWLYRMQP